MMAGALAALPVPLAILRPNWSAAARWPALLWRYRAQVVRLIGLILPNLARAPTATLTALACIPRALEVAEEVRASRSDIVHLFWSRHAAMALTVLRETGWSGTRTCFVGAYDLIADDFLVQLALDEAEAAFSHAEANRDFIKARARPGLPLHIIHRGIPLPKLDPDTPRDDAMWLTASALVPEKNVEAVLRLFAVARARRPDLKLTVCGEGPDRARLEALVRELDCAEAVRFAGHVDRQALFGMMHRAGTFLLLSKKASERLPNVIKEALWSGCAVIASPSEGIEELVPDRGIGLIIDPDDTGSCAEAVDAVLGEDAEAAAARRQRARELIASRFSNIDSMARYVEAWQALGAQRALGGNQRQP